MNRLVLSIAVILAWGFAADSLVSYFGFGDWVWILAYLLSVLTTWDILKSEY